MEGPVPKIKHTTHMDTQTQIKTSKRQTERDMKYELIERHVPKNKPGNTKGGWNQLSDN
jgi:hypothetical protein